MSIELIKQGEFIAKINTIGSSLIGLTNRDFHLIEPDTASNLYPGSILAPWPNRIRDGKYSYQQKTFQLPINESTRSNALHGLVAYRDWQITKKDNDLIQLNCLLDSPEIYPGKLDLSVIYKFQNQCLYIEISAINIGDSAAPYGVSIHTYLVAGANDKNNNLWLTIPADHFLQVDSQRLLPTKVVSCSENDFDFRNSKKIGELFIDHAFKYQTGLDPQIELVDSMGRGVVMGFDPEAKWIQIHTADRSGGADSRNALAVEPMSCPPDAFNSLQDLIELSPGQTHTFKLWIKEKS